MTFVKFKHSQLSRTIAKASDLGQSRREQSRQSTAYESDNCSSVL